MKMNIQLEKTEMECAEGLNHVMITLVNESRCMPMPSNLQIHLELPSGLYASKNKTDFPENSTHTVTLAEVRKEAVILFELFTEDAVPIHNTHLTLSVLWMMGNQQKRTQQRIPLQFVSEDAADQIIINRDVANYAAKLKADSSTDESGHFFHSLPLLTSACEPSPLEKKYRMDGLTGVTND